MSRFQVDPNEQLSIFEFEAGSRNGDRPNVITIRARMNVGQANLAAAMAATRDADGKPIVDEQSANYLTALLVVNITSWEGPDFDDLPCTPETIRRLPGNDEFIMRVHAEIVRRNKIHESPDQKKAMASGSSSDGSKPLTALRSVDLVSVNGTTTSHSPKSSAGRRSK